MFAGFKSKENLRLWRKRQVKLPKFYLESQVAANKRPLLPNWLSRELLVFLTSRRRSLKTEPLTFHLAL